MPSRRRHRPSSSSVVIIVVLGVVVVATTRARPHRHSSHLRLGTYGTVVKAKHLSSGTMVAMKRIRLEREVEGFPITALREIRILRELRHENLVALLDVVKFDDAINLVFEYVQNDLTGILSLAKSVGYLPEPVIKSLSLQLLDGLRFLHLNNVLHRDLKCSNLLVSATGALKIADFGLARPFSSKLGNYTVKVITLWYRPPELLLGERNYTPAIDVWSAGCIVAELVCRGRPLLPAATEAEQLALIFKICGTDGWPTMTSLPWAEAMVPKSAQPRRLRALLAERATPGTAVEHATALIDGLLTLDPSKRSSAAAALDSNWFWTDPLPAKPGAPAAWPRQFFGDEQHEMDAKRKKAKRRA